MKVIYDFDGTLTPYSMPKFKIIEESGMENGLMNPKFKEMSLEKQKETGLELYAAMYEVYFDIIKNAGFPLVDSNFALGYDETEYNKGVQYFLKTLFDNNVENYILSSGVKVFFNNIDIRKYFKDVYGTTFNYNDKNEAISVDFLMSDKNKVEAIKDIQKKNGKNIEDCSDVIYIGDGLTDYYAMEYVKSHGGKTIFVYLDESNETITKMKENNIVDYFVYADFSKGKDLDLIIRKLCKIKE